MKNWRRFILGACVLLISTAPAQAAEEFVELLKDGYGVFYENAYLSFEGCEYDKAYTIGPYVFICREYEYDYAYGDATILGRTMTYQGQRFTDFYLCMEEESCYEGDLYRK